MKIDQATLALILLLLTAVAATVGGLVPQEPFYEEEDESHRPEVTGNDDETPLGDESGEPVPQGPPAMEGFQSPPTPQPPVGAMTDNKFGQGNMDTSMKGALKEDKKVEAFTGSMYAGF